ncbi:synaptogyrin-1a isoform X1 [Dicentrarchus labrax]|uniref:synaptogyrin-1a isoform X1 n=1 Tax=Dicentrarchus labrax TaxID=13489 RepID=UPI0021F5DF56|nr:synaptogyrin-1a isoform X1 [Dicentrarchus labrax]
MMMSQQLSGYRSDGVVSWTWRPTHTTGRTSGANLRGLLKQAKCCVNSVCGGEIHKKLFSIVILGCVANEGYINRPEEVEEFCIFNRNHNACNYAVSMATLCFLCSTAFLALDVYFPRISSVKDRKKAVVADIGVSVLWALVWFVGFCFLANQWQVSKQEDNPLDEGADAARAAIVFSFFSVFTWGGLTLLSLERLKRVSFEEEYNKLFSPPLA